MSDSDDRISLSELRIRARENGDTMAVLNAYPVLDEIAAAGLTWLQEPLDVEARNALVAALSKVRP